MRSNSCFRKLSDLDTAYLLETRIIHRRTASRVLSVAYATDKSRENPKSPDVGISVDTATDVAKAAAEILSFSLSVTKAA
jgi:hypothetical protein